MFFIASAILVGALFISVLNKKAERLSSHDDLNKNLLFYKNNEQGFIEFYKGNAKGTNIELLDSKINERAYNRVNEEATSVSYDKKKIYLTMGKELDVEGNVTLAPENVILSTDGKEMTILNFSAVQPQLPDYQTSNYQISFAGWNASTSEEIVLIARSANYMDENCCEMGDLRVSRNLIVAYNYAENKAKVLSDKLSRPIEQIALYDSNKNILLFAHTEMPGVQIDLSTGEATYNKYGFGKASKDAAVVSIVSYDLNKAEIYQADNPSAAVIVVDAKIPSGPKAWGRIQPLYWSSDGSYFIAKYETSEKIVYEVHDGKDGNLRYYKEFDADMPSYKTFMSPSSKYVVFRSSDKWMVENIQNPSDSFVVENSELKPLMWLE